MMGVGGIPVRPMVCSTLVPRGAPLDDTARIQAAINVCQSGQVVQLTAGTFNINGGNFLLINKGITPTAERGRRSGIDLAKTDGAKPFQRGSQRKASPLIVRWPARWTPDLYAPQTLR